LIYLFLYFIRNIKYDYYYAFNLFPVGFWTVFWSKVFFKKSIITFYGADACDTRTSKKVIFLQRFAIVRSYLAITISEFTKNKVIERYKINNSNNIKVIYPILPEMNNITDSKLDINKNDFIIIAVCRLVKRKGIEYLLEAMSLIKDKNIRLIVIGDGPERNDLGNLKDKYNLLDRVIFTGRVPDIEFYYNIAKVAVLVSYNIENEGDFEGLGLVLLEAQSYGLPVIGTRSGGIPEAIEENKTGFIVEEKNARSIADAIIRLKNDTTLYSNMNNRTKDFLEERFGKNNTIKRLIDILKR